MAYVFLETQSVVLEMSLQPMVATQFYLLESYMQQSLLTLQKDNNPAPHPREWNFIWIIKFINPAVC